MTTGGIQRSPVNSRRSRDIIQAFTPVMADPRAAEELSESFIQSLTPEIMRRINGADLRPMVEDPLSMLQSPERKVPIGADALEKLRQAASTYPGTPSIIRHVPLEDSELDKKLGYTVPDWSQVRRKGMGVRRDLRDALSNMRTADSINRQAVQKVGKVAKTKGHLPGRTYTSRYRGVHQTFPTKRWEAQFRRNGKPTSLGCFDEEEEAARAYDKMMIWCELHHSTTLKAGITNFDMSEYEKDIPLLNTMSQDDLTQSLRSDGRRQAAQRLIKQKREGQILHYQQQQQGYATP